jgi:hypothetical protein
MALSKELQHRRTHNLLLVSKLLNCRENASPFTLVLDTLEQSSRPLTQEIIKRAKVRSTITYYFEKRVHWAITIKLNEHGALII